jgi:hypothetical protein
VRVVVNGVGIVVVVAAAAVGVTVVIDGASMLMPTRAQDYNHPLWVRLAQQQLTQQQYHPTKHDQPLQRMSNTRACDQVFWNCGVGRCTTVHAGRQAGQLWVLGALTLTMRRQPGAPTDVHARIAA